MTPDTRAQLGDQGPAGGSGPRELLRYRSAQGRRVVTAMILGSSVAGIDSTVVAVARPAIGRNLHAGFQALQWTVTAYTLTGTDPTGQQPGKRPLLCRPCSVTEPPRIDRVQDQA